MPVGQEEIRMGLGVQFTDDGGETYYGCVADYNWTHREGLVGVSTVDPITGWKDFQDSVPIKQLRLNPEYDDCDERD